MPPEAQRLVRRARKLNRFAHRQTVFSPRRRKREAQAQLLLQEALDVCLDSGITWEQFLELAELQQR